MNGSFSSLKSRNLAQRLSGNVLGREIKDTPIDYDILIKRLKKGETLVVVSGNHKERAAVPIREANKEQLYTLYQSFKCGQLYFFQCYAVSDRDIDF